MAWTALNKQLTLQKPEESGSDPAWINHSVTAMCCHVDQDRTLTESPFAQYLVDQVDVMLVKMYLPSDFSANIRLVHNLLNLSSKLQETEMIVLRPVYRQSNRDEAANQILNTNP